jgi:hypothetical protein
METTVKKSECILILKDLKEQIGTWEWDTDYYDSGQRLAENQLAWTLDRIDAIIKVVEESDLN